jgi:KDO2-lipid IV(A) lauroyltransferase
MTRDRSGVFVPETARDAFDRRSGGRWTAAQAAKNFVVAWAVRGALRVTDRLPRGVLLALGRTAGRTFHRLSQRARRTALERAAGGLSPPDAIRVARACFERAGENLAICLLLRRPSERALAWVCVPAAARATLERALAEGRGAVFVSAHLGPFELVASAIAELGYRPAVVVRESYDRRLDACVDSHRLARGIGVIHRGDASASLRIVRALRAGQPVGLLPDLGGRVASLRTRFLGGTSAFPVGPQHLALRTGAPLLVGTLARRREPRGVGPLFDLRIQEVPAEGNVATLTQRVATVLSQDILKSPEDWLWMAGPNRPIADGSTITLDLPAG